MPTITMGRPIGTGSQTVTAPRAMAIEPAVMPIHFMTRAPAFMAAA